MGNKIVLNQYSNSSVSQLLKGNPEFQKFLIKVALFSTFSPNCTK